MRRKDIGCQSGFVAAFTLSYIGADSGEETNDLRYDNIWYRLLLVQPGNI